MIQENSSNRCHLLCSRDFGTRPMHHQMSILSAPPPLSSFLLPLSSPHSSADVVAVAAPSSPSSGLHCPQVWRELGMEAFKSRSRLDAASSPSPQPQTLSNEGFSVEELLNLWDFEENEKERAENEEVMEQETEAVAGDQQPGHFWNANAAASSFSSSSALSFERSRPLSEISLPAPDAEELEWLSFIIDDSVSEFPAEVAPVPSLTKVQNWSDDPQHESSQRPHSAAVETAHGASLSCATVGVVSTEAPVPPKAKRSKRPRALTVGWSSSLPSSDSSSTTSATSASSCPSASSSSFSSCLLYDQPSVTGDQSYLLYESRPSLPPPPPPPSKKMKLPKKRGRKPKQQPASTGSSGSPASSSERRCSHCGAQKTPQWRAGPLGAKTLCNACGVRYKSGRLLPEYRPACSPTYVDSIHSSSHRKVLELRRRKETELLATGPPPVAIC